MLKYYRIEICYVKLLVYYWINVYLSYWTTKIDRKPEIPIVQEKGLDFYKIIIVV